MAGPRDSHIERTHTLETPHLVMPHIRPSQLLMGEALSDQSMIENVRDGLPLTAVSRITESMALSEHDLILENIGMSQRTYQRRKQARKPLDPIQSDRLYRLAKIEVQAINVFEDQSIAIDWLKTENRVLGATPISLLDTEVGTEQVEKILNRIEYGMYS